MNDPFFGRVTTEDNMFLWPSNIWEDMQHEAQHAVGQDMIDLSITHRPRNQMVFDKLGNISGYVERPDYPMGLIEKNRNLGTKNWGKGIGGKAEEIDAELHAKIAKQQYLTKP